MIKNLPKDFTRDDLLDLISKEGFAQKIDLLYVPMSFEVNYEGKMMCGLEKHTNFGYGFINFITPEFTEEARTLFHDFKEDGWEKCLEVQHGDTVQGKAAHVERYRNSPVMHEEVPDLFKPAMYQNGERYPFPAPTKPLRKVRPRLRKEKKPGDKDKKNGGDGGEDKQLSELDD